MKNRLEYWKIIKNHQNYEISNFGKIRRVVSSSGTFVGKILKTKIDKQGYERINLCKNCKKYYKSVHSLVLETFVGLCPAGMQCNHKDGNKTNNHIDNLEWVTPSDNQKHAHRLGLKNNKGEKHSQNKLTENNVITIRKLLRLGLKQETISKFFYVHQVTISDIKNNKTWSHLYDYTTK